jgi:PDZ domain-containing secreted protein
VFAVILVLESASTNDYALTPGQATPVAPLVAIKGSVETNAHPSKILLVDVYLSSLSVWEWIKVHFQSHVQIVPADELVEPGVSTSELLARAGDANGSGHHGGRRRDAGVARGPDCR